MKIILASLVSVLVLTVFCFSQSKNELPYNLCWEFSEGDYLAKQIASDNVSVYLPFLDGSIKKLDFDGKLVWENEKKEEITFQLSLIKQGLLVLTVDNKTSESYLKLLSKETGLTFWRIHLKDVKRILQFQIIETQAENEISLFTDKGQTISIDTNSGKLIKIQDFEASTKYFHFPGSGNTVYLLNEKTISKYDLLQGNLLKLIFVKDNVPQTITESLGLIIITDSLGNIYAIDSKNQVEKWKIKLGGGIVTTITFEDNIYFFSNDNFIYAYSITKGQRLWKRKTLGRIAGILDETEQRLITININERFGQIFDLKGNLVNQIQLTTDNFFIGNPFKLGKILVFPTKNGIIGFKNGSCLH